MTLPELPQIVIWLAAGAMLGAFYFWLLGLSVAAFSQDGGRGRAFLFIVLRLAVALAVMTLAALQGTGPLLLTLAGFVVIRTLAVWRARGAE